MRNLLITISYNGAYFHGFQVQKNAKTVMEVLTAAVEKIFGQRLDLKCCSRTDTGVHAEKYCFSIKTEKDIPCKNVVSALNVNLPDAIAVLSCVEVDLDFHARYSSKGKRYKYRILNSDIKNPFLIDMVFQYRYKLDENQLNAAAQSFVGTHDFAAFCSKGSDIEDTVRTIYDFTVRREGDMVIFSISGNGFLYNMVRIFVGTLLGVAQGRIRAESIPDIILSKNRRKAGVTAPAQGLYLTDVFY